MSKVFQEKLETKYGGCCSFAHAAERLKVSERVLMQKMVVGEVIVADCDGRYMFPVFQFKNGNMLPGLSALLEACIKNDPEWLLDFFWTPLDGDLSPVDMLQAGITEVELDVLISYAKDLFGTETPF